MPTTDQLFPVGYGLKRVNPQAQYHNNLSLGDLSSTGRCTSFSARGVMSAAAGTWQTVLDVSNGTGYFDGAALSNNTANSVTPACGLRVTIDGTVFDVQTASSGNSSAWCTPCDVTYDGGATYRRLAFKPLHIPYVNSLKVEVLRGSADTFSWAVWHAPEF